uniref:Myb-like domain-containing protein n=1 Tax=Panagrolaimus sp. JU765 TaxID=591449 RepID=A0AC34QKK0_9BILA
MVDHLEELLKYSKLNEKLSNCKSADFKLPSTLLECVKTFRQNNASTLLNKFILYQKKFKIRKWALTDLKRADGMIVKKWIREKDDFRPDIRPKLENKNVLTLLEFSDGEYDAFLKDLEWSKEETKYLLEMYRKYSTLWAVIADRYSFGDKRRSVYQIRQRFHFVYDSMCEARKRPDLATHYDPHIDLFNLRYLQRHHNRTADEILRDQAIIQEAVKLRNADTENQAEIPRLAAPISATPMPLPSARAPSNVPETPTAPAAPIQKGQVSASARSSSSAPESRHPSVSKTIKTVLDSAVDYTKQIEPAKDTSALRFFSRTAVGPHFRSQEIRLLSNVNQKKRNNIENVCDNLKITNHLYYDADCIEHYTRFASGITAITELKNVYDTATNELVNLHREYCEKTGNDEQLVLPKLPEAPEGKEVIWDKIDPSSSSLGSLLKRKLQLLLNFLLCYNPNFHNLPFVLFISIISCRSHYQV